MKSYARMFDNINQLTQPNDVQTIQIIQQINPNMSVQFSPNNINFHGQFQRNILTLQSDIDNHLNISQTAVIRKIVNIKHLKCNKQQKAKKQYQTQNQQSSPLLMQDEFVYEMRNKAQQLNNLNEYIDYIKNKKILNPVFNYRNTITLAMKNVNITQLYNQQGKILAFTANMKFDIKNCQLLLGTENVNILSQGIKMAAAGVGMRTQKCELIGQFNTEKTTALGIRYDGNKCSIGSKLQVNYSQLSLDETKQVLQEKQNIFKKAKNLLEYIQYNISVGMKKSFNRGEVIINVNNQLALTTSLRLALNQNNLLELNCIEDLSSGKVGFGVSLII